MTEDMRTVQAREEALQKLDRARLVHAYVDTCASRFGKKAHLMLSGASAAAAAGSLTPPKGDEA